MNCISCQAPVHPEFVHSIKSNCCPACGGAIMNEAAQELLKNLGEALEKMPNDPHGIAGWLLSNYELRKIGTGEPVNEFYGSPKKQPQVNPTTLKVPENRIQKFFEQAGIKKVKKPEDYAEIVKEINGPDYGEPIAVEEEDAAGVIEEAKDPVYTQKVLAAMQTMPTKKTSTGAIAASPNLDHDTSDLHPALREDRMARLQKQVQIGQGGKVGKIGRIG